MSNGTPETLNSFSLTQGGPFFRLEHKVGLTRTGARGVATRTVAAIVIAFVPLVVLAALQGVLFGTQVRLPLFKDLTVYARFVLAIPLLLHAETMIDARVSMGVAHFRASNLLEGRARSQFEDAIARLERTRDSVLPEIILVAGALVLALLGTRAALGHPVSTWQALTPGDPASTTWAGRWLELVSLPVFTFLIGRWLWRIFFWSRFLMRVSRADLNLIPTHPDGSAGLAFLGTVHTAFGAFLIPVAASVAARAVQWVQVGGGTLQSLRNPLIAFALLALALVLGPLQAFVPRLLAAKRRGLFEYARLAGEYTGDFDQKWLRRARPTEEPLLGTSDIQSLADLANSYEVIRRMRPVPLSKQNLIALVASIALPMLPFLLAIYPLNQLLKQVAQLVIR